MAIAKRGGLVAALRRDQQEAHHAAEILRRLRDGRDRSQAFQIAAISFLVSTRLALARCRAADGRNEVDRDQVFLCRPAQRRARDSRAGGWPSITVPASTMASRAARRSALENWSAGSDRYGLRLRRSARIVFGQRLDPLAFPQSARPRSGRAARRSVSTIDERGCGAGSSIGTPLSARSISLRAASRASASSIAGKWPSGLRW